jgi:hypothetical protein
MITAALSQLEMPSTLGVPSGSLMAARDSSRDASQMQQAIRFPRAQHLGLGVADMLDSKTRLTIWRSNLINKNRALLRRDSQNASKAGRGAIKVENDAAGRRPNEMSRNRAAACNVRPSVYVTR